MKGTRLFEDVPLLSSEYAGRVQTNKRKRGVARSLLSPSLPPSTGREHWRGELEGGGDSQRTQGYIMRGCAEYQSEWEERASERGVDRRLYFYRNSDVGNMATWRHGVTGLQYST